MLDPSTRRPADRPTRSVSAEERDLLRHTQARQRRDTSRREAFWETHGLPDGRGLEIGPLNRPLVTRAMADVHYVDVQDRRGLVTHYADDAGVDVDLIPDIDYTLIEPDGRVLQLSEAAAPGAPFAWVVASHVIEHVPDVIGWLADIAEIAEDGAALFLVVPDRRYCFDVVRPPTSVGQMIEAHLAGHTRPSPRAIYDYFSSVVDYQIESLWRGEVPGRERRLYPPSHVEAKLTESLTNYVDAHVWLFTPQSFVEQMRELRLSGRSSWYAERITQTTPYGNEFEVVMRRVARSTATGGDIDDELVPQDGQPEWFVAPEVSGMVPHLENRVSDLARRLTERGQRLQRVRDRQRELIADQRATIEDLRREVQRLRDREPRAVARLWSARLSRRRSGQS